MSQTIKEKYIPLSDSLQSNTAELANILHVTVQNVDELLDNLKKCQLIFISPLVTQGELNERSYETGNNT